MDIRHGGRVVRNTLMAVAVGFGGTGAAVTNECYVAAGDTKSVSNFGYTFAKGDWLKKTGPGQLNAVNNKSVAYNILVEEGVYYVANNVYQQGGATLIVRKDATVNLGGATTGAFVGDWNVYLAGDGVGTGDNLGAFCMGGNNMNNAFGTASKFYLSDAATIYSYGTMNAVFSGSASSSGPTFYMNGHPLTIRGKTSSSVFRPRWKWIINNPGKFIVKGGQFTRHKTTNEFSGNIPSFTFTDGAQMQGFTDSSIWNLVDAFFFDYGSKIIKGGNGEAANPMTLRNVTGPVAISADEKVKLAGTFTARGTDLVAGHHLTSATTLTFAEGCKVAVSDWGSLSFAPGARHVVAEATSIVGTPALTGVAADLFTLETGTTQVVLVAKESNKVPALLAGVENAAHNSDVMAAMTLADGDAVLFPGGEYHFAAPIDFSASTAKNVSFSCLEEAPCTLQAGLKLGAMEAVTVRNLTFKGFDTPAIVATGTVGLTVEKCTLERVKGTYGTRGNFPYALVDVTEFKLVDPTYVADAADADSTLWDGPACFDGGSQTPDSQARAGEIVVKAPTGIKDDWSHLARMTNGFHLTQAAYGGKTLRKVDAGTLDVTTAIDLATLGITAVEIAAGQYVARADTSLGVAKSPVHVCSGGGLTIVGKNKGASNRVIAFSGTGSGDLYPAVRFTGEADWDKTDSVDWTLEGDATMYNNCSGECGTFLWGTMHMGGHTLTLKGIAAANYRFGRSFTWYGGGTTIVDKVTLSASSGSSTAFAVKDDQGYPTFRFVNKAKFLPDNTHILNLVKVVDFADGTSIGLKSGIAGFDLAFDALTGTPAISNAFTKLTIRESYTARLDDLTAGKCLTLAPETPLAFADRVTVTLADDALVKPKQSYTLISASGGITGNKPSLDEASKEARWGLAWQNDATGKHTALLVGPKQDFYLLVR